MSLPRVDRILKIESGKSLSAERTIDSREEHFRDHFPGYPVYPGVLMLEGLLQSAAWCVREAEDFSRSQVYLTRCSQAKFSRLVKPDTVLAFHVEVVARRDAEYEFKGRVEEKGVAVAAARFQVCSEPLDAADRRYSRLEQALNEKSRRQFTTLMNSKR